MGVGSLFPFCRGHTETDTLDHEPWSFGEEVSFLLFIEFVLHSPEKNKKKRKTKRKNCQVNVKEERRQNLKDKPWPHEEY